MEDKARLIHLAGELKNIADRLLECCKEDDEDGEKLEVSYETDKPDSKLIAAMLKKRLSK